jgi:hypothetical protein
MDGGNQFFAALTQAGMPNVPADFSVVPHAHIVPLSTLSEIDAFIRVFEQVTTRPAWTENVGPKSEPDPDFRTEVCFFSAWDFHLPPDGDWQLIEMNDNGSGVLFAALINRIFYETFNPESAEAPPAWSDFTARVAEMVSTEAIAFFGAMPGGLFLILEDPHALRTGRFRQELVLLRELFRAAGWPSEVASPADTRWDGRHLLWRDQAVSYVVNRSTDFFWEDETFSALHAAYRERAMYVAPNPFTYATRSDKRVLEFLSRPDRDRELGIGPDERRQLSAHVAETRLLGEENLEALAQRKAKFFFKPVHGFAGRGVLTGAEAGRTRLRRLLKKERYIAQKKIPKATIEHDGVRLWTDLRVWAYRGKRYLISGRASRRADRLDLQPPGGWLPTYPSSA